MSELKQMKYCEKHNVYHREDDRCRICFPSQFEKAQKELEQMNQADGIIEPSSISHYDFAPTPGVTKIVITPKEELKSAFQESSTGSLRYNAGKPITNEMDPAFILGIGEVMERSRLKYERGNWAKGNDFSVPYDSMMRHLLAFQSGEEKDKETNCDHLLHAATNLMFLYYYSKNFPEFDDRLFKKEKK